jgi:hypothetical protein
MRPRMFSAGSAIVPLGIVIPLPAAASAGSHKVSDLQVLSGPSPFAGGCPGALADDKKITGDEIEPAITSNPANRRNIIATWQQDAGLGARSDLIGTSLDGGKTWAHSTIPRRTACTGGTADFASDPWISAGADGTVYFSGTSGSASSDPPPVAVVASHSNDGGRSWQAPVTVAPLDPRNDTDAVTASPTRAGHAYLVWGNWDHQYHFPMTNFLRFSRTTDGGATWPPATVIDQPGPTALDFSGRLLVLRGRTLLTIFARADLATGRGELLAARSPDEGRTWLPPVQIGSQPVQTIVDPETGVELPQPGFPTAAARDGTVYAAFEASTSASSGAIGLAMSWDGGRTWSASTVPGVSAFAFEPSIAAGSHGTVGLAWYDLRNDRPGDAALTTDVWLAQSHDSGATWRQTHLAGPFNLRAAPLGSHGLGEYQGLAALPGRRFAAIFTLAAPLAKDGPTDIFVAKIPPGAR